MREYRRHPVLGTPPRVGVFPAWMAWGAILLVDLALILLVLVALTWVGDRIEDIMWPGGPEWVDL